MNMIRLAFMNFKNSFKSYLSLILSLTFTILVFFNFQNIIYSKVFAVLGQRNKDYIDMLIEIISIVLGCFMFFFLWYATNVFLTRRKREIGIYIFMGMSNRKIGGLYMIEISLVGITALVMGIGFGAFFAGLFQMIMGALSDIAVQIGFIVSWKAIKMTSVSFLILYLFFTIKGYWNITHSSVLDLISAARHNEYVQLSNGVLLIKTVLGIIVLASGYYTANKRGENAVIAVVLVIVGVYLLFGGLIPFVFQTLSKYKGFLYRGQRCLWVNQFLFRMKKNYRTYAMVCIIGICSTTALATGFAMRERYQNMVVFDNQYTFQLYTNQNDLEEKAADLIKQESDITYQTSLCTLAPDDKHLVLAYSDVKRIAQEREVAFTLPEPADDEVFFLSHMILLSAYTTPKPEPITIGEKTYWLTETVRTAYLGYMQREMDCFYIVSDQEYARLQNRSSVFYIHNYKIANDDAFDNARAAIDSLSSNTEENKTARVAIDPYSTEREWIKIVHSLCIFLFLVFIVAGGCIMFMKLYNDAFEEKERYLVLKKLGFSAKTLSASIAHELITAYLLPFLVMAVSAYFSVHALGKMMFANLLTIYIVSTFSVLILFALFCVLSFMAYRKTLMIH